MNSRDRSITDSGNIELSATRIAKRIEKVLIVVGDQDGVGKSEKSDYCFVLFLIFSCFKSLNTSDFQLGEYITNKNTS